MALQEQTQFNCSANYVLLAVKVCFLICFIRKKLKPIHFERLDLFQIPEAPSFHLKGDDTISLFPEKLLSRAWHWGAFSTHVFCSADLWAAETANIIFTINFYIFELIFPQKYELEFFEPGPKHFFLYLKRTIRLKWTFLFHYTC